MIGTKSDTLAHLLLRASPESIEIFAPKLNKNTRLNFMGKISYVKSVFAYEAATLSDGTKLFIDGSHQRALTADFVFPAWLISITTEDQATMQITSEKLAVTFNGEKIEVMIQVLIPKTKYGGAKDIVLSRQSNLGNPFCC